jgi:hypothetical protein
MRVRVRVWVRVQACIIMCNSMQVHFMVPAGDMFNHADDPEPSDPFGPPPGSLQHALVDPSEKHHPTRLAPSASTSLTLTGLSAQPGGDDDEGELYSAANVQFGFHEPTNCMFFYTTADVGPERELLTSYVVTTPPTRTHFHTHTSLLPISPQHHNASHQVRPAQRRALVAGLRHVFPAQSAQLRPRRVRATHT